MPSPHEFTGHVLGDPDLVLCNPSFGGFLSREAGHHRRETSGHNNFNSIGRVLLRNDPVRSASMRMFFRHGIYMVINRGDAISRSHQ